MAEWFLRDDRFERMDGLLRHERRIHTKDRARERRFLEAAYWIDRSGAQWRLLPAVYGAWNSVYKRFARWDDLGVWERRFARVADEPDLQRVTIDAAMVRAHAGAVGAPTKTAARRRRRSGARAGASAPSCRCWSMRWATH